MIEFEPGDIPVAQLHAYLLGGVAPRPIALVSTVSPEGAVNLSPFSFFNAFGANPPTVAFSASRRVRDNTLKNTYTNLVATKECVIQAVTHAMVRQVSLASTEFDPGVDEFVKSGLTPDPSDIVKPPRVKESPFQMECRLQQMVELGGKAGSGNLAICEVLKFHIAEDIVEDGIIQPDRIDLVARMSSNYYCRASGESIFAVKKPIGKKGIGYDQLPEYIRKSDILSANNLAQLANVEVMPSEEEALSFTANLPSGDPSRAAYARFERQGEYRHMMATALALSRNGDGDAASLMERAAKRALDFDDTDFAWQAILASRSTAKD
jgi:flavin reductase (DIM6/NTAB) family NADH-FMN oxidoreductase RutF